jgi:hypothetical protein
MNIYLDNKVCVCVWSNIGRWNEGSMYVLIDTFILWRMSLAAMSEWFGFGKTEKNGLVELTWLEWWVNDEWRWWERQFQLYLFMASADSFHLWGWKRQLYSTAFLSFLSQQLTITVVQNLYFYTIGSVLCDFGFNSGAAQNWFWAYKIYSILFDFLKVELILPLKLILLEARNCNFWF